MNRWIRPYVGGLCLAAVAISASLSWRPLLELTGTELAGVAVLIMLGIVGELMAFTYVVGRAPASSSISFIPIFASILVFPPAVAFAAAIIIVGYSEVFIRRREPIKVGFNVSQVGIATALASLVYGALGSMLGPGLLSDTVAFACFAITFFIANNLQLAAVLALAGQTSFPQSLRRVVGPGGTNLFYDLLVSPLALITAILFETYAVPGILLTLLPLLLIRYSYVVRLRLEHANRDLLDVLVKTIETRDPYTSGHSRRVATLARLIAEGMKLSARTTSEIETAGLLHDIGKIEASFAEIIRKPGSLTPEEMEIIKTHATRGAELLEELSLMPGTIVRSVRHHHEHYDGSGYPDGLRGHHIPLGARVIMACDSIDAMLSDRPYRRALPVEAVESELRRCSGSQFDPQVVAVVLTTGVLERFEHAPASPPAPPPSTPLLARSG